MRSENGEHLLPQGSSSEFAHFFQHVQLLAYQGAGLVRVAVDYGDAIADNSLASVSLELPRDPRRDLSWPAPIIEPHEG